MYKGNFPLVVVVSIVLFSSTLSFALEPPAETIWESNQYHMSWMGPIFVGSENHDPWLKRADLGWLFVGNPNSYNLWLWESGLGWLYTNWQIDPWMWSPESGWLWMHFINITASGWVYFEVGQRWELVNFKANPW